MWKLLASVLSLAAVAGPVTVALAASEPEPAPHRAEALAPEPPPVPLILAASSERAERRAEGRAERRRRRAERHPAVPAALEAIARCESGGDPHNAQNPTYRGKYQFSRETWASIGGSGDPAEASEAEQDRRAARLYASAGAGQWPVCGHG